MARIRFVGREIDGAIQIDAPGVGMIPLSYSQARLLDPSKVYYTYNQSDRGGPHRLPKRWNNWYAWPADILAAPRITTMMRERCQTVVAVTTTTTVEVSAL